MPLKEKSNTILLLAIPAAMLLFACGSDTEGPREKARQDSLEAIARQRHIDSVKRRNPLLIIPPDSTYTGTYVDKYESGIVKFRGFFRQGQKHGQWMSFYPNGISWSELHFDKGKRHGPNITYYENGKVRYSGLYKNDMRDSIWVYYDSAGNVAERALFREDRIIRKLGPETKQ